MLRILYSCGGQAIVTICVNSLLKNGKQPEF
jgi:hypothetical protein